MIVGLANHTVLVARDGTERPIDDSAAPIRAPDGSLLGVVMVFRDVTGQRHAENELRASEARKAAILETALDCIITMDHHGRVVEFNPAAEKTFGFVRSDVIGKELAGLVIPPSLRDRHRLGMAHYLATGEGPVLGRRLELPALRADGTEFPVEIAITRIPTDGPPLFTAHLRDISERKRVEEALRRSEEHLRAVVETTPACIKVVAPDGTLLDMNSAGLAMVDADRPENVNGECVYDLVCEEYRDAFREFNERVCRGEKGSLEFGIVGLRGTRRHMETCAVPLRWPGGGFVQLAVTHDITDRKRAEDALRESEEKLRLLADTIPQLAWTARPDGHIFWYNRRWYEYTGTTPEQMEGWGWQSVHDPATLPDVLERWRGSIATGEPFDMVFPLKGADGRFRPFLTRVNPLRDEQGRILYWFGTNTDVSEQQRAAEASRFLSAASAALAAVVDYESTLGKVAGLAVPHFADWCAVDMAGEGGALERLAVAHADPERVRLAEELHRRYPPRPDDPFGPPHVLRTGRPEMAADLTDEMLAALAQDADHLRLLRELRMRSYISVPVLVRGRPLGVVTFVSSESGRSYGPGEMALAQDLAHRAAVAIDNSLLYQQLRDADRRKDEFLATLAHELRNPLAPIRNALQILKMPRVDAKTVERSRDMMERQLHHLVRLVDDLLDVSRVMRGKIELRRERVELATVVARAVETVQPLIEAQRHELSVSLPPESLPLDADPVRLAQVVGNLLTNAAKYTEPGGHIWLTAAREGGEAVLRIRDDGIGIAPDVLPHVFELFVQVDHAATRSQGGLGIGLTLVKNLCEMHGGSVEARSAGLGEGSEFVVRLPLSAHGDDHALGRATEPDAPPAFSFGPPAAGRGRQPGRRRQPRHAAANCKATRSGSPTSGPAALETTKTYTPDVVFLDIGMPGMDGYEVARRMRRQPGLEKVVLAASDRLGAAGGPPPHGRGRVRPPSREAARAEGRGESAGRPEAPRRPIAGKGRPHEVGRPPRPWITPKGRNAIGTPLAAADCEK